MALIVGMIIDTLAECHTAKYNHVMTRRKFIRVPHRDSSCSVAVSFHSNLFPVYIIHHADCLPRFTNSSSRHPDHHSVLILLHVREQIRDVCLHCNGAHTAHLKPSRYLNPLQNPSCSPGQAFEDAAYTRHCLDLPAYCKSIVRHCQSITQIFRHFAL